MLTRLRYRIARALVGRFATIPAGDGPYVVIVQGDSQLTLQPDEFHLEHGQSLGQRSYGDVDSAVPWLAPESDTTFWGRVH